MTKEQFLKMGALSRKDLKVLQILHAVFREPGISRSRLCDRLDLNKNNMTDSVKFMLDEGYLRENGQNRSGISGSGRRSIGLTLRPGLFYTLGATLTLEDPAIVLQDAARNVVEKVSLRNEGSPLPERFLEEIKQKCAYLINKAAPGKVLGIGLALPGIIDCESGEVISSQAFNSRRENLRRFFQENFGLELYMINESHVCPLMEKLYGAAAEMENFVTVDEGLGCGMYFHNRLYRGWQYACGELGYMKIADHQEIGPDGRNGLLVDRALFGLIGKKIIQVIRNGSKIDIERTWQNDEYIPPEAVVRAIEGGNLFVAQLLSEMYSHIGDAVVNMAYLLNPQAVFLPHWTSRVKQYTVDVVRMKMGSYGLSNWSLKTEILSSECPPSRRSETVAYLFTDDYFERMIRKIKKGGSHE